MRLPQFRKNNGASEASISTPECYVDDSQTGNPLRIPLDRTPRNVTATSSQMAIQLCEPCLHLLEPKHTISHRSGCESNRELLTSLAAFEGGPCGAERLIGGERLGSSGMLCCSAGGMVTCCYLHSSDPPGWCMRADMRPQCEFGVDSTQSKEAISVCAR